MTDEMADRDTSAAPLMLEGAAIPDLMPGEPNRTRKTGAEMAARLVLHAVKTLLLLALTSWLWPFYLLLVAAFDWAPNVPRLKQVVRYLKHTWSSNPPSPGLAFVERAWLSFSILKRCATAPVYGLAWLLDEVLYGATLNATPVVAPLIEISAARSGSTQLARYLEDDLHLVAPPFMQCLFPYLWLWRLVPQTIGRFVSADRVRQQMEARLPPEFFQRHEGDPFLTDTFDMALLGSHLNNLSPRLGPDIMETDFSFGALAPHNVQLWEEDFVNLLDRIARKTLMNAAPDPEGKPRRFFVKGHFLCAADALAEKYPDACFLTMVREPAPRLQSAVNFLRAQPFEASLGAPPWPWLATSIANSESAYCEIEREWFDRTPGPKRCVLRFSEYINDLEATMTRVYRECLDTETLPAFVPTTHSPRERKNYLLNRSLAEVGIDEAALNERLADYIDWCRAPGS